MRLPCGRIYSQAKLVKGKHTRAPIHAMIHELQHHNMVDAHKRSLTGRGHDYSYDSYVYMLPCSVLTSPPPWYGPPRPWAPAQRPTIRLFKAACLPYLLLLPRLVKFLAKTMQFNTTCKDYVSINQHSHQSTRTTSPQGGRGANHDHAQGEGGGATLEHIYYDENPTEASGLFGIC